MLLEQLQDSAHALQLCLEELQQALQEEQAAAAKVRGRRQAGWQA